MELISSDEEESESVYWNNWLPTKQLCDSKSSNENRITSKTKNAFNCTEILSVTSVPENIKLGNWVPPMNFFKARSKKDRSPTPTPKANEIQFQRKEKNPNASTNYEITTKIEVSKQDERNLNPGFTTSWRKEINLDWGKRVELHDVTKFNDEDLIWGVVNLGVFGNIKLWVNEYGNICCSANGKISKLGSSEVTFISITDNQLLRKMLNVSSAQWVSLCESLLETKIILNFDTFQNYDLTRLSSLEKLWLFMCKRRHFLPRQCMLVKFSGAVKCMTKFKIIPKLIVQEIRNILGEQIL